MKKLVERLLGKAETPRDKDTMPGDERNPSTVPSWPLKLTRSPTFMGPHSVAVIVTASRSRP